MKEKKTPKFIRHCLRHPMLSSIAFSALAGILCIFAYLNPIFYPELLNPGSILFSLLIGILLGCFFVFPIVLTAVEICFLLLGIRSVNAHQKGRLFDIITIPLGFLYSLLYLNIFKSVQLGMDWETTLTNANRHTPVYTQAQPTLLVIALLGFVGYLIVNYIPMDMISPLALVTGLSAMYLGTFQSILWMIQIYDKENLLDLYLLLFPANCIFITARTVISKSREWKGISREIYKIRRLPFLNWCNHLLERSELWPIAAFLLMWPLLGILVAVLTLFGQSPDSVIRAWTETSGWNLSRRVSPQNIYYDEHYLCTVAAGGHKKIVKPLRLGTRHGHEVIVNRQLCVANAFEQILEEKTPHFHRVLRNFYDKYGFPVARLIHSQYTADAIYVLMKPLEWIFLAVLYLVDTHPENRIALQYTGKSLKDFQ